MDVTIEQAAEAKKNYYRLQELFYTIKDIQYSVHYPDPMRAILDPLREAAETAAKDAFMLQEDLYRQARAEGAKVACL